MGSKEVAIRELDLVVVVGTNFLRLVDCAMQSIYPTASVIVYFFVVDSISKLKKQQERLQREAEEVRKRELFLLLFC